MACDAIKNDPDIVFMEDVISVMPISRAQFYKKKVDKIDTVGDALTKNKSDKKKGIRKRWDSSNAASKNQETLYRLIANQEERDAMNPKEKIDITGKLIIPPTKIEYIVRKADATN